MSAGNYTNMKISLKRFIVEKEIINSIKIILHQEHVNVHTYKGFYATIQEVANNGLVCV